MRRPVILITAVGSLVGKVVLDSLEGRREYLHVVGCDVSTMAANLCRCDDQIIVPVSGTPEWRDAIVTLVRRFKPCALIPGIDGDVYHLSGVAEHHPELAAVFVGGSLAMAKVISKKSETATFSRERGLPYAESLFTGDPDIVTKTDDFVRVHGFPLIAKPDDGSGSIGVRILTKPHHLEKIVRRPGMIIQPLLDPGGPIDLSTDEGIPFFWEMKEDRLHGVQFIIGCDGRILGCCAFRSRMVRGRCEELWENDDPELLRVAEHYCVAAIRAGWRGPFNVQAKRNAQGQWRVIELNGRFSGGTSSRLFLGFDEVKLVLDEWSGAEAILPPRRLDKVRRVVRMLADYPVADNDSGLS